MIPEYSLVLPAYCEEENLRILLPRVHDAFRQAAVSYEVVVVDTVAPLDATEEACRQLEVRYARRSPDNYFGDAVRTGIREARGRRILFMDADGSHGPEWIPRMIAESGGADVVIASRYVAGGTTENTPALILMSKMLNFTYSLFLNLKVKDVSNSFKLYDAALLKGLKLKCRNFDIIEEILFKIKWFNPDVRIKEIPFTFKTRMFGRTKRNLLVFMITYIYTMIRLRFFSW
ncbi:MAG: hypothetical protein A2583_05025 [Bdellovibrionales bacterium RIFOXYD1_FULL_53_11]|nr:MAG: hypothetical protein A2583_05025 [Bdellovibrionales bacterium RIFOXYD1_FULL_53_11]